MRGEANKSLDLVVADGDGFGADDFGVWFLVSEHDAVAVLGDAPAIGGHAGPAFVLILKLENNRDESSFRVLEAKSFDFSGGDAIDCSAEFSADGFLAEIGKLDTAAGEVVFADGKGGSCVADLVVLHFSAENDKGRGPAGLHLDASDDGIALFTLGIENGFGIESDGVIAVDDREGLAGIGSDEADFLKLAFPDLEVNFGGKNGSFESEEADFLGFYILSGHAETRADGHEQGEVGSIHDCYVTVCSASSLRSQRKEMRLKRRPNLRLVSLSSNSPVEGLR